MLDSFDSDSDKESVIVIPSSMEKAKTLQKAKHRSRVMPIFRVIQGVDLVFLKDNGM